MSHTTSVKAVEVKDHAAIKSATDAGAAVSCDLTVQSHTMFDNTKVEGVSVQLAGWSYPVIFDAEGKAHYDNYGGRWGDEARLDEFIQQYASDVLQAQLLAAGFVIESHETDSNGDIVLSAAKL